ncbi:MAG TPA: ECF transporter S component [Syntrophales bacterium]|nr:ECF transporter S component [Syntrophales bacterium]HPX81148.1 ECF transporter S component [Syntrophales bacterium]HQB13420.1 ECF transporter S component [Syntrophales bacterium]
MGETTILSWDRPWNRGRTAALLLLALLPNVLGMINLTTPWGFKIHTFQAAIFLAAAVLGPWGGLVSGLAGSLWAALVMANPWLLVGNGILGFCTGLFVRRGFSLLPAVWLAFSIQLLWLIPTDYFLAGLSGAFIRELILALLLSHTCWALVVAPLREPLRRWLA